jgi:hypothetical protein
MPVHTFLIKTFHVLECGGNFTTNNGTIMSPEVNNMYPSNADCVYQITVPSMYRVLFKVERLILQDKGQTNICSDYLQVNIIFNDKFANAGTIFYFKRFWQRTRNMYVINHILAVSKIIASIYM